MVAGPRSSRYSGRFQHILICLLVDKTLLLEVIGEITVWAHVLHSKFAHYNMITNMFHATLEVIAVVSATCFRIEETKLVTEPCGLAEQI